MFQNVPALAEHQRNVTTQRSHLQTRSHKKKSREDGFERDVTIRNHPSYTAEPHTRCPKKKRWCPISLEVKPLV